MNGSLEIFLDISKKNGIIRPKRFDTASAQLEETCSHAGNPSIDQINTEALKLPRAD